MWSKLYTNVFGVASEPTPEACVHQLREAIIEAENLEQNDAEAIKKAKERVAECILALKGWLFGEKETKDVGGESLSPMQSASSVSGSTPNIEAEKAAMAIETLVKLAADEDLLLLISGHMRVMGFETRKLAVQVFNNLIRKEIKQGTSVLDQVSSTGYGTDLVCTLARGYDDHEVALNCGSMLRECLKSEAITKTLLYDPVFWRFFEWVEVSDFDVASDAQTTFKDLMIRHPGVAAEFIEAEYNRFFEKFNLLLRSPNYVARRQSLKLLGEMLLERANFNIMANFISSTENLKLIMNLLLDNRKNIQYEAFHVFKIFVANPNKTPGVRNILVKNKEKMVQYLSDFLPERDDEQFHEDRQMIIQDIEDL